MSSGEGFMAGSASSGALMGQAASFLAAGGRPTPKLLLLQLQSRRLNQSPAGRSH